MERLDIALVIVGLTAFPVDAAPEDAARERHCIQTSARYNRIPAALLRAIRLQEGGSAGGWHVNTDSALDYGVMQINSRWLPLLAPQDYSAGRLTYDPCTSVAPGACILAHALARYGAWNRSEIDGNVYWRAVGDYHSHTASLNRAYAEPVWNRYRQQLATGDLP